LATLYERWLATAQTRRDELALHDIASGSRWTFGQLRAAGEVQATDSSVVATAQGHSPEFIFSVVAAWRVGKTLCPLESDQARGTFPDVPKNCAHLKWTSGTAEAARLVAFTGEQLAADADHIVPTMGLRADWPNLGVISLAHSYGFSNLVLPLLLHGIPLVLVPAPLPEIVRRAAQHFPAITLPAVPALWRAWHEANSIPSNVRLAISAGAPLPLPLEQAVWAKDGLKIHNFYGASECGGIAYDASQQPREDGAIAGTALAGVELSVGEDDGCLVVRGDSVCQTYLPATSDRLGAGKFHTSDLAELRNGVVYLRGRAGDQINVAGRKISPETIERALARHPRVRECLVFGVSCDIQSRTETIVAMVAAEATEKELRQFLLETLPAWQVPRCWRHVDSLSTNSRGKVSRAECRAQFMSNL
jgi:acyl-CoA synthetase (AMP-forming)/AMP-acid ligase II